MKIRFSRLLAGGGERFCLRGQTSTQDNFQNVDAQLGFNEYQEIRPSGACLITRRPKTERTGAREVQDKRERVRLLLVGPGACALHDLFRLSNGRRCEFKYLRSLQPKQGIRNFIEIMKAFSPHYVLMDHESIEELLRCVETGQSGGEQLPSRIDGNSSRFLKLSHRDQMILAMLYRSLQNKR